MLDAVSALPLQGTSPGSKPRDVVVPTPVEFVQKRSDGGFVSSSIRVDNLQNVAILEYRSETGEVVQQYPTQSQIDAFKRAAALQNRREAVRRDGAQSMLRTGQSGGATVALMSLVKDSASVAPTTSAPTGSSNSGGNNTTQSFLA